MLWRLLRLTGACIAGMTSSQLPTLHPATLNACLLHPWRQLAAKALLGSRRVDAARLERPEAVGKQQSVDHCPEMSGGTGGDNPFDFTEEDYGPGRQVRRPSRCAAAGWRARSYLCRVFAAGGACSGSAERSSASGWRRVRKPGRLARQRLAGRERRPFRRRARCARATGPAQYLPVPLVVQEQVDGVVRRSGAAIPAAAP